MSEPKETHATAKRSGDDGESVLRERKFILREQRSFLRRAEAAEPELDTGHNAIFGWLTFVKHMLGKLGMQTLQRAQKVVPSQLLGG